MICPTCLFRQVYFDDGDSVDLGDDGEDLRRQLDAIEPGGFDKYQAYLDCAQVNLEVSSEAVERGSSGPQGIRRQRRRVMAETIVFCFLSASTFLGFFVFVNFTLASFCF